jgi:hypothetical protein
MSDAAKNKKASKKPQVKQRSADLPSRDDSDQLKTLRLLINTAGRAFRAIVRCLTHQKKQVRVFGWIVFVFLLGVFAAFVYALLVRWEPLQTILFVGVLTGLVSGANLIDRYVRRSG